MSSPSRVVIAGATFPDSSAAIEVLETINADVLDATSLPTEETIALLPEANALITDYFPVDATMIDTLGRCRIISRLGVGVDKIDVEAATRAGIAVAYVPDYCRGELADHALALMLSLARRIVVYDRAARDGSWDYNLPNVTRLAGRTLGLVGFGAIARAVAERARPIGLRILVSDPYVPDAQLVGAGVEPSDLPRLLDSSDIVSLHAPLTPETTKLIGAEQLAAMKETAILINTARGGLIDEVSLADALKSGSIAGAGLDVLSPEPPAPDNPLLTLENVVVTPHAGHYSLESVLQVQRDGASEVVRALTGKPLLHPVNDVGQHER